MQRKTRSTLDILGTLFAILISGTAFGQTYNAKPGDTLQKVAAEFYGSEYYDRMIVKHNGLGSTKDSIEGKSLQMPELSELLFKEGLDRTVQSEIDLILKARYTYMVHRNDLLRAIMPAKNKSAIVVPLKIRDALLEASKELETAAKALAVKGNFYESPVRMRRELLAAARNLKKMARGKYKMEYDDSIHKKLSTAFFFGIAWARDEEGNTHKLAH